MPHQSEAVRFLKANALAAVIVLGALAIWNLAGFVLDRAAPAAAGDPLVPPPAALDSLNPAVLIEGGTFVAGSDRPEAGLEPGHPYSTANEERNEWTVEPFWMQAHEVTNEEYRRFDPGHVYPLGDSRHPVTNVTFREAMEYALSVGGRLPTEVEWEYAARGSESWTYPWGEAEPRCDHAHFRECEPQEPLEVMSLPAGSTPAGVHDLAGNVWEWVMPTWHEAGRTPINRESRRMRGGSFMEPAFFLRGANKSEGFFGGFQSPSIGFRVVWGVEE